MDYNEFTFDAPAIFNAENPIFPLRLTKNSVVGYSEVTEITRGNGKIKYYYTDPILFKDSSKVFHKTIGIENPRIDKHGMVLLNDYGSVPLFPLAEKQSNEIARGHLFKQEFYKLSGDGNYQLIKKSESNYYAYNIWSDVGFQHANSEPTEPGFDNLTPPQDCGPFILNPIEKVYADKSKFIQGQKTCPKGDFPHGIDYYINTGLVLKYKTKTTTYLDNGEISSEEQFKFNNIGQIEKVTKLGRDKVIETTYNYPNEVNHSTLYDKNMISTPYKQITKEDGNIISASDQKYNAQCLPTISYSFGGINSNGEIDFEEKLNCKKYDEKGHLLSCETSSGMKYCYVWGYNNTKVVAEIIGLDYTQISSKIYSSLDTEESIINFAENMRFTIKSKKYISSITAYTYKPLIGISSKIDNNGLRTFYEYDEFGRLCKIRNNDGYVLKSYKYNYKH
jgi:YD repeat-containing protein